jgi:hypothetical protein
MPRISWATREKQWLEQRAATPKGGANPLNPISYELRVATHPHEAEIPSNRMLATCGEYVPDPCTHCPSIHPSVVWVRCGLLSVSNPGYARWDKSTQGIRRGTCGWITSFFKHLFRKQAVYQPLPTHKWACSSIW